MAGARIGKQLDAEKTAKLRAEDKALLQADFQEFYDANLGKLADAAIRWIESGGDDRELRARSNKAYAESIPQIGPHGAQNIMDDLLRVWQENYFNYSPRNARDRVICNLMEYKSSAAWRFSMLLFGSYWCTGQSGVKQLLTPTLGSMDGYHERVFRRINASFFSFNKKGAPLALLDKILSLYFDDEFPALQYAESQNYGRGDAEFLINASDGQDYLVGAAAHITLKRRYSDALANAIGVLGLAPRGFANWLALGLRNPTKRTTIYETKFVELHGSVALWALGTIPSHQIAEQIGEAFLAADTREALLLIDLLARQESEAGRALLAERLGKEKTTSVREAIERALRMEAPKLEDDDKGYIALDGSRVEIPPLPEPVPEFPVPDSVRADIRRFLAACNEAIARENESRRKRHEAEVAQFGKANYPLRLERQCDFAAVELAIAAMEQGWGPGEPYSLPPDTREAALRILHGVRSYGPDARVKSWSTKPLHLKHLLRLVGARGIEIIGQNYYFAGREIDRRLATSVELRSLASDLADLGCKGEVSDLRALEAYPNHLVWPYFAERMDLIAQAFAQGKEQEAMALLSRFPKIPQRFVPTLLGLALSDKRTQWAPAQKLLGDEPSLTPQILPQLSSKAADRRRVAAQWLGQRGDPAAIGPLHAAAKKEKATLAYAAMLNALKALGADLSKYFEEAKLMAAAEASQAKAEPDAKGAIPFEAMPSAAWADGRPAPRALLRHWLKAAEAAKLTSGNAEIDLYLNQLQPADAAALGLFTLRAWLAHDTQTPSAAETEAFARAEGAAMWAAFQQHQADPHRTNYEFWYYQLDFKLARDRFDTASLQMMEEHARRLRARQLISSAYENRGLLSIAARAPAVEMVRLIRAYLKDHYKRMGQCKVLLDCLAANGAPSALQLIFATATRSKNKGVQKHASALVDMLAEARGWTRDELADRTVPTAGFDETGALELEIGDKTYVARLTADLNIGLCNPDGGKVSALPTPKDAALAAAAKEAKAALLAAKKELKQTAEMQATRFYEALCAERVWSLQDFKAYILQHPILSRLAERLIWLALDATGKVLCVFRPLGDGTLTTALDEAVDLDQAHSIRLAHLSALSANEAEVWLQHLADYEVKPLFSQLTRPRFLLPAELSEAEALEDRQGWVMDTFKLRAGATKLGWKRGPILDAGSFEAYEKMLPGLSLKAVLLFSGSMVPEENIPAALFGVRFERTRRDGDSVPMLLAEIPPVLLSEVWNDYQDIAAAGAFDPHWESVGPW